MFGYRNIPNMARIYLETLYILTIFAKDFCSGEYGQFNNFSCSGWQCQNEPESVDGNSYLTRMGCFCDDLCNFFDDCCEDSTKLTSQRINNSIRESIQCTHHCKVSTQTQFYAVVQCPKDYPNQEVSDLCSSSNNSDLFLQVPATGESTGLIYRNIYCAQCHEEKAELWQLKISCVNQNAFNMNDTADVSDLFQRKNCFPKFLHPKNARDFRPCHSDMITACPQDADPVYINQCTTWGQQLVYSGKKVYRNPSCAVCNGQTSLSCWSKGETLPCDVTVVTMGLYSMSLLFDISAGQGVKTVGSLGDVSVTEMFDSGGLCTSSEIYDPFKKVCRKVTCDTGYTYTEGRCEVIFGVTSLDSTNETMKPCPRITLNESDFTILEDGRLLETSSDVVHDPDDVIMVGNNAAVCVADLTNSTDIARAFIVISVPKFSSLEGIISATGMILSLIALAVTIVIYITFRTLRNVPGCNIMCLSFALFAAELMMLTAPNTENIPTVCKIFAIGMHYCFLSAFMWMNVIAIDAWSTFSRGMRNVRKPKSRARRFTLYSLYAWMGPSVPVGTAILMDVILPSSPYAPAYGQEVCWIRNRLAVLVFFASPLGFIILLNTIMFTLTSLTICSVKKSSARKLGREDRGEFLIYIKLFVVMGLTWVLGFLSAFVPHPVTTYLYIVANSLQGLFIGISFVCTRKVLGLFRERVTVRRTEYTVSTDQQNSFTSHM